MSAAALIDKTADACVKKSRRGLGRDLNCVSLRPQTLPLSPARPSLPPSKHISAKRPPPSKPSPARRRFYARHDGDCVSLMEKLSVATTDSTVSPTSRCFRPSFPASHVPLKHVNDGKQTGPRVSVVRGYQQPTVSSRARALSPYTHRRMCQLSEDANQRLSHLQLGPHYFRRETESQQPFLVGNFSIENPSPERFTDVLLSHEGSHVNGIHCVCVPNKMDETVL